MCMKNSYLPLQSFQEHGIQDFFSKTTSVNQLDYLISQNFDYRKYSQIDKISLHKNQLWF